MRNRMTEFSTRKRSALDVFVCLCLVSLVYSFNIDLQHPVVFRGPDATFFGYSVLEHVHDNTRWIVVGAPRANSSFSSSVQSPGAVYKCRIRNNPEQRCTEMDLGRGVYLTHIQSTHYFDRNDEWFASTLTDFYSPCLSLFIFFLYCLQACAHRWKNVYYESEYILPHGYCSVIPATLQGKSQPLIPCYEDHKKTYGEEHGSCQAGIAGVFTEELVIMGAPGSYYWTGTVKVFNMTSNTHYNLNQDNLSPRRYSYLGYAVTAGHFSSPNTIDVAAGAPQDSVKIYLFGRKKSIIKAFQL
uniref:Integrin, alpha 9 n=1 Tax=Sinocyclocheilus rhinocerous TaxID=307959 RepID=A0A673NKC8_9TELE